VADGTNPMTTAKSTSATTNRCRRPPGRAWGVVAVVAGLRVTSSHAGEGVGVWCYLLVQAVPEQAFPFRGSDAISSSIGPGSEAGTDP